MDKIIYQKKSTEDIEKINKLKYDLDYTTSQTSINPYLNKDDYFFKMTMIKKELINKYGKNKKILDIGCATGDYLIHSSDIIKESIGIDFSKKMLKEAITKKCENIEFITCTAKALPFNNNVFDMCYSYSTLYYIPNVETIINEVSRVLKEPNGIAILDLGNLWSLNTIVCNNYPNTAISCHITCSEMKDILKRSGLKVIEIKRFQILPLWGNKPFWLKPLLHPMWKKILQKEVGGKMLDEWISNMPLINIFAFRYIFICKKSIA